MGRRALTKNHIALISLVALAAVLLPTTGITLNTPHSVEGPGPSVDASSASDDSRNNDSWRLHYDPAGGVTLDVPEGSYVSRRNPDTERYRTPSRVAGGQLQFAAVDRDPRTDNRTVVYVTDRRSRVTDVMVFGSYRSNGRLTEFQSLMSKKGVELVWLEDGKSAWTVQRNGVLMTSRASGHYVDNTPRPGSTRYTIRHVEQVEVDMGGETITANKAVFYVAIMPSYDDALLGRHIDAIGPQESPGIKQPGAGRAGDE